MGLLATSCFAQTESLSLVLKRKKKKRPQFDDVSACIFLEGDL